MNKPQWGQLRLSPSGDFQEAGWSGPQICPKKEVRGLGYPLPPAPIHPWLRTAPEGIKVPAPSLPWVGERALQPAAALRGCPVHRNDDAEGTQKGSTCMISFTGPQVITPFCG